MIIECPECKGMLSTEAKSCPHCGYEIAKKKRRCKNRRRRLPNGFGQISELKNRNLRKPFRVMITIGMDENGKYITKPLKPTAYFRTYNEAYIALMEYNKEPYDVDKSITVAELYKEWIENTKETQTVSTRRSSQNGFINSEKLHNMDIREIRARHIKNAIEETDKPSVKIRIRRLYVQLFDYALDREYVTHNYGKDVPSNDYTTQKHHDSFSDDDMELLWTNQELLYVDMILIQCYSGWRPNELCTLELENIHLDERYMVGGSKTDSGRNRCVPIHDRIYELVRRRYEDSKNKGSKYLFVTDKGMPITYGYYRSKFKETMSTVGILTDHQCHDCRVQFVTMAKKYDMDEYAIKRIVGHSINDVTEKIYTKRSIEWLATEMRKIR